MNYKDIRKYNRNNVLVLSGIPAAPGYAIGSVYIYEREKFEITENFTDNTDVEIQNLIFSIEKSRKELKKIVSTSLEKIDKEHAKLFEAHLMILDDPQIMDPIKDNIKKNNYSAEFSIDKEFRHYINSFDGIEDPIIKERTGELEDVRARLIRNSKKKRWESKLKKSAIIVTHNLTPADTLLLSKNDVLAYISEIGGLASHTAIISRSLNIPAVVGIHDIISKLKNEDIVIVDGFDGLIIVNPDSTLINQYQAKIDRLNQNRAKLQGFKNKSCLTSDDKQLLLSCNVEFLHEVELVKTFHADGIGLYRSETQFFEKGDFPDEAEQIDKYSAFSSRVFPEKIVIRTFDIGGDKVLPESIEEKNPFLGWRGIRMMLDELDIFQNQIRAILKSSQYKNVRIMLPMISKLEEVWQCKEIIEKEKEKLKSDKVKFDTNIQIGIMAEVPSVAFCIEEFAKEVDFVSVGTNDLIQYTLAVDRGNEIVSKYFQEYNPAILRVLKHIVDGAHRVGIPVSICGEMASDLRVVPYLYGIGFDELSVNVHSILKIKKYIRNFLFSELKEIANNCLKMYNEEEIQKYLNNIFNHKSGETLE